MQRIVSAVLFVMTTVLVASAQQRFVAHLTGAQEVPGNFSTAKGSCKIVLNAAQTQITANCTYSGLGGNAIAAHIHGSGAVGSNAPIVFDFGAVSGTSGSINPAPFPISPSQLAALRAHLMYVNVHSSALPDGEIRGQIKQAHTTWDNDGDGRSDPSVYRRTSSEVWSLHSLNGGVGRTTFGSGLPDGLVFNTGDFDGDGRYDPLLIKGINSQWVWTIFESDTSTVRTITWGNFSAEFEDVPVPADYDSDGELDVAIFRTMTGDWWIIDSSSGSSRVEHWGSKGDHAAVGDYDGDGKADLAVARSQTPNWVWYIRNSSNGSVRVEVFGRPATDGLHPFSPVDWDGDGRRDIAIFRNTTPRQNWILKSSDGQVAVVQWGLPSDIPHLHGDFDGDGRTDFAVRRSIDGFLVWYILRSSDLQPQYATFGRMEDG